MQKRKLPEKTVERLSQYRRTLLNCLSEGKHHIFSHELANLLHITSVQVRRDIMLMDYSGTLRQGYDVKDMIDTIGRVIDSENGQKIIVVGVGNLGRAIIGYLNGKRNNLSIIAAFDNNPEKVSRVYAGVQCYHIDQLEEIMSREQINIAILTVPSSDAASVAELLVNTGIRGILNFTPKPITVPAHVYLQEFDMITSIEKVAYFVK